MKFRKTVAAAALTFGFLVPAGAASAAGDIMPGAFCGVHGAFAQHDGAWYVCALKGDHYRWLPTSSPAPSVPASASASATASVPVVVPTSPAVPSSKPASPTKSASSAPAHVAAELPVTGSGAALAALTGVGLIAAGAGGLMFARRRRV